MPQRVAVTGIGILSPIGNTVPEVLDSLREGRSGISIIEELRLAPVSSFLQTSIETFLSKALTEAHAYGIINNVDDQPFIQFLHQYLENGYFKKIKPSAVRYVGLVNDFNPLEFICSKESRKMDRFQQLALAASEMAKLDAGLEPRVFDVYPSNRIAVIAGSSMGGMQTWEDGYVRYLTRGTSGLSPFFMTKFPVDMAAAEISRHQEINGPVECCGAACATGALVVGRAFELIRNGIVDAAFATASEAGLTHLGIAGFEIIKALSTKDYGDPAKASRPFDRDRSGFIMAEGAASLLLENLDQARKRGARIYAEIIGFGNLADAFHQTQPNPDGVYAAAAMEYALKDGAINKDEVDYINAHGTSTFLNDKIETTAIKRVFGCNQTDKIAVSSTKSTSGHLMGAAGALEAAVCALALHEGFIPPTINYENPAPECDLADYVPNEAREIRIGTALSNSFGFGGRDATLALKRFE